MSKPPPSEVTPAQEFTLELLLNTEPVQLAITGASGFVGGSTLDLLEVAALNGVRLDVTCISRRSPMNNSVRWPNLRPKWVPCDLTVRTPEVPAPKYIIHAASTGLASSAGTSLYEVEENLALASNLVAWVAKRTDPARVLLTSSGAVYGEQSESLDRTPEDSPLAQGTSLDSYTQTKLALEERFAIASARGNLELQIARLFTFHGPNLDPGADFAVVDFINQALRNRVIKIKGGGEKVRSYLYEEDMAAWLLAAIFANSAGGPIHIGSARGITLTDLANVIGELTGARVESLPDSKILTRMRYVPEVTETLEYLKVEEWTSLEQGLIRTLESR